jgi:hypothetical protein
VNWANKAVELATNPSDREAYGNRLKQYRQQDRQ